MRGCSERWGSRVEAVISALPREEKMVTDSCCLVGVGVKVSPDLRADRMKGVMTVGSASTRWMLKVGFEGKEGYL